jgi:hypothetical protein
VRAALRAGINPESERPAALELHMTAPPVGHMTPIGGSAAGHACYDRATAPALPKLRFFKLFPGPSEPPM